jgi:hypothetical protein
MDFAQASSPPFLNRSVATHAAAADLAAAVIVTPAPSSPQLQLAVLARPRRPALPRSIAPLPRRTAPPDWRSGSPRSR